MASEIRVDKINSLSGVGTVTLSPTGVDISGITTVATFKVGTGVTASSDGDIFATGVTTSTTFSGNFSGGTVSGTTGTFTGAATLGNGSGLNFGDTGARIIGETGASGLLRFDTNGGEKVRIDASGRLLIGTTTEGQASADDLTIATSGNTGITLRSGTSNAGNIYFSDATSGTAEYAGYVSYSHSTNALSFGTNDGTERARIDSSGRVMIGSATYIGGAALAVLGTSSTPNAYGSLAIGKVGANPTSGTTLANIRLNGGSVGTGRGAEINAIADANWSDGSSHPTYLTFSTVASSSTSATERIRVHAGGNVDIKTGNLVISTAGKGIDFSAQTATSASGASTSTEVLDHYEEGTFTPYSPSLTVEYSSGHYIRIGSYVCASIRAKIPSNSNANTFVLDGLPFNCRSYSGTYHNGGYLMYSGGNSYGAAAGVLVYDNSDRLQMYTLNGGNIMLTNLDNIQVRIQVHYFV